MKTSLFDRYMPTISIIAQGSGYAMWNRYVEIHVKYYYAVKKMNYRENKARYRDIG